MAGLRCLVPVMGALFQSRGWLPIVEAPGYSRHPTSTLAMQLLISVMNANCILINVSNVKTYLYPSIKFKLFQESDRLLGRFSFALMLKTCPTMCTCH